MIVIQLVASSRALKDPTFWSAEMALHTLTELHFHCSIYTNLSCLLEWHKFNKNQTKFSPSVSSVLFPDTCLGAKAEVRATKMKTSVGK